MTEKREATKEEMDVAFTECINDAKRLLTEAMHAGMMLAVSPMAMMVMAKAPDFGDDSPFEFNTTGGPSLEGAQVAVFSALTLTPPGKERMPNALFWKVIKLVADRVNAYAVITAGEFWVAAPKKGEKLPASLEDYEHREEALSVFAEKFGEYQHHYAFIRRNGDTVTLDPWEDRKSDGDYKLQGRILRSVPANRQD